MNSIYLLFLKTVFILISTTAVFVVGGSNEICGGELIATSQPQTLVSPNYPAFYENNLNCVWIITPQNEGKQVEVFVERIDTEACCDALDLMDGLSSNAKIIANLRGALSGEKYITAYGGFRITFKSDESVGGSGFALSYKTVDADSATSETLSASNISDIIVSPKWPLSYPSNAMNTWVIQAEPNLHVGLTILYLKTEGCCDGLTIRNGVFESSPLIDDLRGEHIGLLYASARGGALSLRFYSDNANMEEELFDDPQSMQAKTEECQEKIINVTDGYGMITPPGFPGTYPSHLQCSWIISAPEDSRIRVWFSYVNTEECCDWIKIRDGEQHNSKKVGLISGNSANFYNSLSTNRTVRLEFDTDSKNNSRGFVAYYEVVKEANSLPPSCGGEILVGSDMQYVASPGWPQPYNETTECVWHFQSDPLMKIRLIILGFLTEPEHYNILAFDGPSTENIALLDLNSDVYEPLVVSTTTSWLTLSYFTLSADKVDYGGFRAAVVAYNDY